MADSWAAVIPDEHHLKPVLDSLGVAVDGFVGYPVYRRCYLAVHGPESRYLCYPYPDRGHIARHEWDRVGIELRRALRGQPGESRSLRLARDPEPIEIEVAVDRLLEPLPTD